MNNIKSSEEYIANVPVHFDVINGQRVNIQVGVNDRLPPNVDALMVKDMLVCGEIREDTNERY